MKCTTKKSFLWFLLLSFSLWFVGCGSSQDEPKSSVKLDACALLAAANPESILGEPVGEPHSTLQQHDANMAVSQCGVSARGSYLKTVSLLVKYYRKYDNPKSAKDFLDSQDLNYAGVKFTPHEVSGLGDVAVSLSSPGGFQLWVFWKKHYRMNISLTEFDDQTLALEKARAVAQQVMSKL